MTSNRAQTLRQTYANRQNSAVMIEEIIGDNELLQESFREASAALLSLRAEDEGWLPLNKLNDDNGFTLKNLKEIAELAELQTTGNPLLKRGLTLRTANVFGRGISFPTNLPPRFQSILDKPANKKVLFTEDALDRNEKAAYNAGNLLMAYDKSKKLFFPIPLSDVTGHASNPRREDDVWFYQHSYNDIDYATGQTIPEPTIVWYPVLEFVKDSGEKMPTQIAGKPVDPKVVVIDFKVNTSIGKAWGVPDVLPAMPYAWAHSEYVRDASKLLKALATIAWKVVSKNKSNAAAAAARISKPKTAGSTAAMTDNTDLVSMPRSGQVDMKDGQTIAAYVASALEVSLVALLSDPSTASGSYGSAATLDGPTANAARSRQNLWIDFYQRIYAATGVTGDVEISFPKIAEDPAYRQIQSLGLARVQGAIYQDEHREQVLRALDITALHATPPDTDEYAPASAAAAIILQEMKDDAQHEIEQQTIADLQSQAAKQQALIDQGSTGTTSPAASPVPGQGQTGAVGQLSNGNNSARDTQTKAGTSGA